MPSTSHSFALGVIIVTHIHYGHIKLAKIDHFCETKQLEQRQTKRHVRPQNISYDMCNENNNSDSMDFQKVIDAIKFITVLLKIISAIKYLLTQTYCLTATSTSPNLT